MSSETITDRIEVIETNEVIEIVGRNSTGRVAIGHTTRQDSTKGLKVFGEKERGSHFLLQQAVWS